MYMFDGAFDYLLSNETNKNDINHVTNNPHDVGGITKYGISFRFLKSIPAEHLKIYGIIVDGIPKEENIINLSIDQAKSIYKGEFWDKFSFEKINVDNVRNYIFDMAVNSGIGNAIKCSQRACWAIINCRSELHDDSVGSDESIKCINLCGTCLLCTLRSERANFYRMIVEKNPSQSVFLHDWLNRAYR